MSQNGQRLTALWEIATAPRTDERTRLLAMLKAGASALRPNQTFHGQLGYQDGEELVIVAGAQGERDARSDAAEPFLSEGVRCLIKDGIHAKMRDVQGTIGWADARSNPELAELARIRDFGSRAIIGSTFRVGVRTYYLVFFSFEPAAQAFTQDDYAYMDVLASFVASHLHRRTEGVAKIQLEQHTRRLTTLWEIATAPRVDDRARLLAMLEAGAGALRPSQAFHGQLSYQDGDDLVIVGTAHMADYVPKPQDDAPLTEGFRFPIEDGIQAEVLAVHGAVGWEDVHTVPALQRRKRVRDFGGRAIIGSTFLVGTRPHFLMFYCTEEAVPAFNQDDYAYIDVLASFFAAHFQQRTESDAERRLAQNVSRLAALWEIATARRVGDTTRQLAMLDAGAKGLRPGQVFRGQLSYQDGDEIVIVAGTYGEGEVQGEVVEPYLIEGTRALVGDGIHSKLLEARGTIGWDDVRIVPELSKLRRIHHFGSRAVIGSTFRVGPRTYFLLFFSYEPAAQPFRPDDYAYIEVLASFFASQLYQTTQRDRIREQLEIDSLTGLPNRATFRSAARQTMNACAACAIIVIEVDRFRGIVEAVGHQTADALLVEVAAAFAGMAGKGECVGRISGNTFALLMTNVHSDSVAYDRGRKLIAALKRPYSIGDRLGREHVALSVSAGLAVAGVGNIFEELLMHAETALAAAKQMGSGSLALFSEEMEASVAQRRLVQEELAQAIDDGQLDVVYQPTISLATMNVCGAKALLRWMHPDQGTILPAAFLPFAWENGLSSRIGAFVIRRMSVDVPGLGAGDSDFRTYFNLSEPELASEKLMNDLQLILYGNRALAGALGMEITESAAMRDPQRTMDVLGRLQHHGLCVAIDDFGGGHASFSTLKKLPLNVIKINGRLVRGLPHNHDAVAVVSALLAVAESFGCTAIADGVETGEQLAWLKAHKCSMARGYYIARPMSAGAFRAWHAQRGKLAAVV